MRYLWTEDTGAGLHFWKLVNQLFFDNELVVESKGSNQGLLDALIDLETEDGDEYFVAFDYVVDNQDIRNKYWLVNLHKMKSGLLKGLLWVNAGIKIVVCQSIRIILGVVSLRLKVGMRR